MKKPEAGQVKSIEASGQADEGFAKKYPRILEYLMTTVWEDGTTREPSAVSLSIKDGMWQVALNDKALKCSAYSSAATMAEALKLLEGALVANQGIWRAWKRGK